MKKTRGTAGGAAVAHPEGEQQLFAGSHEDKHGALTSPSPMSSTEAALRLETHAARGDSRKPTL